MHTKNFLINQGDDRKTVEAICESLPKFDVIATFALLIKSVNSVNTSTLMVTAKHEKVLRVLNFIGKEKADSLK